MVQVDIFWSFAFGAGFAASAAKQLENDDKPFESKAFLKTLLWLAIFFVPSGAYLLWAFPRWETMQVGTYESIPAWLVALFAVTNITQGMLGFWVVSKLLRTKRYYAANLASPVAWFVFWFVLVHGWDGTGFKRFFYCATDWSGNITPWVFDSFKYHWPIAWPFTPVGISLLVMGLIMVPFLIKWMLEVEIEGRAMASADGPDSVIPMALANYLRVGLADALASAIVASILIHLLGWIIGIIVFLPLAWFVLLREGGLTQKAIGPRFIPFERPAPAVVEEAEAPSEVEAEEKEEPAAALEAGDAGDEEQEEKASEEESEPGEEAPAQAPEDEDAPAADEDAPASEEAVDIEEDAQDGRR